MVKIESSEIADPSSAGRSDPACSGWRTMDTVASLTITDLAAELASLLNAVVPGWAIENTEPGRPTEERVGFSQTAGSFEAWLTSANRQQTFTLACSPGRPTSPDEVRLMRRVASVFRSDLEVVGDVMVAQDLWGALSGTQFMRAAARLSPFSTTPLLRWINVFEAAARQTYEGTPFTGNLVLVKDLPSFQQRAGDRFEMFNRPLGFEQALLREKWLRPFLQDGKFALVTVGHRGAARGIAEAALPWDDAKVPAPVEDLDGLYGFLRPGTSILSASPSGDIHLVLPTGVTFVNAKGKWRYQDWEVLRGILDPRLGPEVAEYALRLVEGASYQRRGSLYVFLNDDAIPSDVVPDHVSPNRAASTLRSTMAGGTISDPTARRLLRAASRIDGAILFDNRGRIIDAASMVSEPSHAALASAGLKALQRFPGARSTAAWNASVHGLAIKVSDDGPVDVYEAGRHIFQSG
jgi:hypothetical protein